MTVSALVGGTITARAGGRRRGTRRVRRSLSGGRTLDRFSEKQRLCLSEGKTVPFVYSRLPKLVPKTLLIGRHRCGELD